MGCGGEIGGGGLCGGVWGGGRHALIFAALEATYQRALVAVLLLNQAPYYDESMSSQPQQK